MKPGADAMELSRLSYAVVDVETTGGSPSTGHRVTEIAAVVVRDGKIQQVYEQLVNPERSIPPFIARLTNISDHTVRDQPRFADIAPDVVSLLMGNVFVAHNAAFDWSFVSSELNRAYDATPTALRLCTVRLARLLLPQLPRRSLDHVAHHYGLRDAARGYAVKRGDRHSAAGDALVTAHCFLRMLDEAADRGFFTLDDLERASSRTRRRRPLAMPCSTVDDRTA